MSQGGPAPRRTAVLLLAHGSPERAEDIPEFLRAITGGRALPDHVVAEVVQRYTRIGFSPLTQWTLQQRDQHAALVEMRVHAGMRNWKPYVADAVREMSREGDSRVIAICLAPQNSRTSVGLYHDAVRKEAPGFDLDFVDSWHDQPQLIAAFAEKLQEGRARAQAEMGAAPPVIFTAHSVPAHTIRQGDPYEAQARETARLVAREAGLAEPDWSFAFQSQGMTGGPWIGPSVEDTILALQKRGHKGVFLQPIGFLCDHVEILYDIDVMFHEFAEKHGMRLRRAESLNGSSRLTQALAEVVRPRATSNSVTRGKSIAKIVKPNAPATTTNGTSGSADSVVPGLAISRFVMP